MSLSTLPMSPSTSPESMTAARPTDRPLLLTLGDVAGIGPEIVVKAHAAGELDDALVVGDALCLLRAAQGLRARADVPDRPIVRLADPAAWVRRPPGALTVIAPADLARAAGVVLPGHLRPDADGQPPLHERPLGQVSRAAGQAAAAAIRAAIAAMTAGGQGEAG
ncbi:MAG: 4-hydroxythreonine-4-phosphate dehydrogenase PdxA, partial [Pseudomonadota bacterium]